jgi:hypothetical protein
MKKYSFLILLLFIASMLHAQTSHQDTIVDPLKPQVKNTSWCVRFCNGIQRSYYFDIGISRDHFTGGSHGLYSSTMFVTYSMFPSFNKQTLSVYGIKGGAEVWGNGGGLGMEVGYYSNSNAHDVIITPKIGIGISMVNIVYGYGFSTNKNDISRIGKHTVALQLDIPVKSKNKLRRPWHSKL